MHFFQTQFGALILAVVVHFLNYFKLNFIIHITVTLLMELCFFVLMSVTVLVCHLRYFSIFYHHYGLFPISHCVCRFCQFS